MEKRPADGIRNTLYDQQTRSGRRLTRGRLLVYKLAVPIAFGLGRLVWRWSRIVSVTGAEHIAAALSRAPSFIPVYWHRDQLFCIKQLAGMRGAGVRLGFLISPSVDGDFAAMMVQRLGGEVIRGSSSHTGARALRDYYQALAHENVSPAITPDGPRGPACRFKPGAILLSQMAQRPVIPLAYAASRAWRIMWDGFVIPKPFARIAIAVGEPVYVGKGLDAGGLCALQAQMEGILNALESRARELVK